jgi:hypothetical protein
MRFAAGLFVLFAASVMTPGVAAGHNCGHHSRCGDCDHVSNCRSCGSAGESRSSLGRNVQGVITETIYLPSAAPDAMLEVRVRSGAEIVLVRLAPGQFLKQNGVSLKEGDAIGVTGYPASTADGDLFVAEELSKNGKSLRLRNVRGRPLW